MSTAVEEVTKKFGLTLGIPKTKLLVSGASLTSDDVAPLIKVCGRI